MVAMAHLPRTAPLTPMDALRALLAEFSEGDTAFASRLASAVQSNRKQAILVLGPAFRQPTSPRPFKRLILSLVPRFDWPEWVPYLKAGLLTESDLGVFDEGCAALGILATREALEALLEVKQARTDPDRQVILARELNQFQSQHGFAHCLGRVMEGQGNPRLALQGAKLLAAICGEGDLQALAESLHEADEVAQQLLLRVIGELPGAEAQHYLTAQLDQVREEQLDNQALQEVLHRIHSLQRSAARDEFLRMVQVRFADRDSQGFEALLLRVEQGDVDAAEVLEPIRNSARGHLEGFLVGALELLLESKLARYSAYVTESSEAVEARATALSLRIDQIAEILAWRADRGLSRFAELQEVLGRAFLARVGGDGLVHAFLRLLPASAEEYLESVLVEPDLKRRMRCLDSLGSREDDALMGFFLKATLDPIVEVGQQAMHHLGKLPSSFSALMALFESGNPEQVRRAIRAFSENQTHLAAEPLVDFIRQDQRDDLLVEAVEALANLRYPSAAPSLLDLLHDGKPLNLQVALSRALGLLGTPEGSLGLLHKAAVLKPPQVLLLCLEGALSAYPGFERPLPREEVPALLQLVERCCDEREGEGQRLPAILAMQGLYVFDRGIYEKLKDRFGDFLSEMRTKESWDRESNDAVANVVKEMARRSESLGKIAQKEAEIRNQLGRIPEKGPRRAEELLALREALGDPELILRPEFGLEIAEIVNRELKRQGEWKEQAHLCEIGGLTGQDSLIEPIRDVYLRASGLGLKSAARTALLRLGLPEADLNRRPPVRSILLLEPSAFFRKRLLSSLTGQGGWVVEEAGSRGEALALLSKGAVDMVVTEVQDAEGPLGDWLQERWAEGRFRFVLLATSHRDLDHLLERPWVAGTLFKPFPIEQLLHALSS